MLSTITVFWLCWIVYEFMKNSSLSMLNKVKTNFRLYPKHYSMPPRWMRKRFKLRKADIPKYLIVRLYIAMAFLICAPILAFVTFVTQFYPIVPLVLLYFVYFVVFFDIVIYIIMYSVFSKK